MVKMLWFQLVCGIAMLISIYIWGDDGIKAFTLIAISPFIYYYKWKKPDEREKYNFFKGTQIIISILSIIIFFSVFILGIKLKDILNLSNVMVVCLASGFIILNSLVRLYLNYKH